MPLAVLRTNLHADQIPYDFMERLAAIMIKLLQCRPNLTMVELHTDVAMFRDGSSKPIANLDIYHEDDKITTNTKRMYAAKFAQMLFEQLKVSLERVLVLFIDTRRTVAPVAEGTKV